MKKIIIIPATVIVLLGVGVTGIKTVNFNKNIAAFKENISSEDFTSAKEIYSKYSDNTKFGDSVVADISEKGNREIKSLADADVSDYEKTFNNLKALFEMGYLPSDEAIQELRQNFNDLYNEYYSDNSEDAKSKLSFLNSFDFTQISLHSSEFFEEKFNAIMSDVISAGITEEKAAEAYGFLRFLYNGNESFVEERLAQIYVSYNNGNLKYEAAQTVYAAIDKSGLTGNAAAEQSEKLAKLNASKSAYATAVNAMNVNDYINAFKNFKEVIEDDINYEQKNNYVNELLR